MQEFSQAVIERIGNYVYFLKDPRDENIFYVGKGKENRIFQHLNSSIENPERSDKLNLIREIIESGHKVEHYLLRHGLDDQQARELESAIIDLLGMDNLTNRKRGYDSVERGIKTINEIVQLYDAEAITIDEPTMIININRTYKGGMTSKELYDATRSTWFVGNRRNKARYVIASYKGLVREVYRIHGWKKVSDKRWDFSGEIAEEGIKRKYINQSLEKYIKRGARQPIRYINC
jgi:hypothetical protein